MILRDCFISENAILKIPPQRVHKIGFHAYRSQNRIPRTSLRTGVIIQVARKFSQSKR